VAVSRGMVTSPDSVNANNDEDDAIERYLVSNRGFRPGDDRTRVNAYQRRWRLPLDILALLTFWLIVVPPGVITSNNVLYLFLLSIRLGLSLVYAIDITVRAKLAPHHWYYLQHNLVSVASVFIPFLRVLLSLQLLRLIFQRGNIGRFAFAASVLFLNLTTVVYFYERHAPHGNIKTVGNALWWAIVTLFTVGYGDFYPVTWQGRVSAALLMAVGFAVLATVTAQISSSFIDQAARARAKQSAGTVPETTGDEVSLQTIVDRLSGIEAQLQRQTPPT
jgi:voltage-gated potassium channel